MRSDKRWFLSAIAGATGLVLLSGCLSTHPGSSSLAYVEVDTTDAKAIRAAALRVFADDGYSLTSETGSGLEFEREATRHDQVLYGGVVGSRLVMRVVVSIEPQRKGGSLVRADAFTVRNGHADRLLRVGRRPYQSLLHHVRADLAKEGGAK